MIYNDDCRVAMAALPEASVDAVVTDPPYELGFMGKAWDKSGIAYDVEVWKQALRVLKPGGHLLAFGGSRTYHRLACAVEDAGFEIRDQIQWVYGSGFPKSLDVSKAIDKAAGAERLVVGFQRLTGNAGTPTKIKGGTYSAGVQINMTGVEIPLTAPATDAAREWSGWGTALKPAHEPIVVARKPLEGTVAANVLTYGTGAINVDGCRIKAGDNVNQGRPTRTANAILGGGKGASLTASPHNDKGRWPANLIHDGSEEVVGVFPTSKDGVAVKRNGGTNNGVVGFGWMGTYPPGTPDAGYGGGGSASRFFYCAKASKKDREFGLAADAVLTTAADMVDRDPDSAGMDSPRAGAGRTSGSRNAHPTVKPLALMRYLCRLITPPGGTVLDPFCGSGSTGVAAIQEGFLFIGIDLTPEWAALARTRCEGALR